MSLTADSYDRILLALCVWREARGESSEGKRAVAWVIRNRVRDPRWPNRVGDVVLQPRQFSAFNSDDPNASKLPKPSAKDWLECCEAADSDLPDPTGGATNYHAADGQSRDWAQEDKFTVQIGQHRFFKL